MNSCWKEQWITFTLCSYWLLSCMQTMKKIPATLLWFCVSDPELDERVGTAPSGIWSVELRKEHWILYDSNLVHCHLIQHLLARLLGPRVTNYCKKSSESHSHCVANDYHHVCTLATLPWFCLSELEERMDAVPLQPTQSVWLKKEYEISYWVGIALYLYLIEHLPARLLRYRVTTY